jgi:integrase/recombinase XerD
MESERKSASEFRPFLRPWITALAQRSTKTAEAYEIACRQFLDVLGDSELEPEAIASYLDSLAGLAPGSRAAKISAVRSFVRYLQGQGMVDKSPLDLLIRPRVEVTSLNRYLNEDEVRALVKSAGELGPTHFALVLLLVTTGLRVGEAAGARWQDIFRDPAGRLGLRVRGKGGRTRIVALRERDAFPALVAIHGSDELDAGDETPLLPSPYGAYSTMSLWRFVKDAGRKAGLSKEPSPHFLRHSYGTLTAFGGASAIEIKEALGHASLETSQLYIHWAVGLSRTATDALPSFT